MMRGVIHGLLISTVGFLCTSIASVQNLDAQIAAPCDTASTPFCASTVPLPANWSGNVFKLSQNYPATAPTDSQPWLAFDAAKQPQQYVEAILSYFYEGNINSNVEMSFDPSLNNVRHWFNAPWQDSALEVNSREPIHGLTRERVSRAFELAPQQDKQWNNYAVGFYNAPGGVAIGKIWADHGNPDATQAQSMPEGTVAAKLLFTTAPVSQVPYLQGSPEWDAYIFANPNDPNPNIKSPRAVLKVRLLQIDVAVKDSRLSSATGWAFGTFVYGGGPGGTAGSGWNNVSPVGLMWGNDPNYSGTGPLNETWLNPKVQMPHVGYQGRLNGPVDNKISSCLSCHSTAEMPVGQMTPPNGTPPDLWFRNIPSGTPFDAGRTSLDYSLQIMVGLRAFENAHQVASEHDAAKRVLLVEQLTSTENSTPAREGGVLP